MDKSKEMMGGHHPEMNPFGSHGFGPESEQREPVYSNSNIRAKGEKEIVEKKDFSAQVIATGIETDIINPLKPFNSEKSLNKAIDLIVQRITKEVRHIKTRDAISLEDEVLMKLKGLPPEATGKIKAKLMEMGDKVVLN